MELFRKKNLPNFELIFCRIFVVAGTVVVALGLREVGHWSYNLNAVADKRCLMAVRCNFAEVGHAGFDVDIVLGCAVLVGVDFWRVRLGAEEFADLRLQPRRRLSFEVQLVC